MKSLKPPSVHRSLRRDADMPSLKGKTIAFSIVGTDHFFNLKAYQAQIAEIERLGGTAIGLDAGRNDKKLSRTCRRW